jgi:hypothetical protein
MELIVKRIVVVNVEEIVMKRVVAILILVYIIQVSFLISFKFHYIFIFGE